MLMDDIFTILATACTISGVFVSVFVIPETRWPNSTLAWMLVLFFAPGIGT